MSSVDLIVVGGGLAGAAVCWQAHRRGLQFALFDRRDPDSSSRVAAGLVTPITGARAAPSWRWEEFFGPASSHYRAVQNTVGLNTVGLNVVGSDNASSSVYQTALTFPSSHAPTTFWYEQPAVRIFQSLEERGVFIEKCDAVESTREHSSSISDETAIRLSVSDGKPCEAMPAPFGHAMMAPAARLDTVAYLDATAKFFSEKQTVVPEHVDCDGQFDITESGVRCRRTGIKAKYVVFCQGFAARENSMFRALPLHPARGDILEIESRGLNLEAVVHSTAWAVPIGRERYLVGATYDRHHLDSLVQGEEHAVKHRNDIQRRWEAMVTGSFENGDHRLVVHRAAVRPASYDRHPLIGQHETNRWAFCLNGLGSKGTLMSPRLATDLLDHMFDQRPIDTSLDWLRFSRKHGGRK